MKSTLLVVLLLAITTAATAQILTTEVWVGALATKDGQLEITGLTNISQHAGYDNQPSFFPDGKSLAYTAEAKNLDETGLGVHAVLFDLATSTATPLPDAMGFSPTPTASGKELMVLRQGRVFLHDLTGKLVRPLTETSEAGYHTRIDDKLWALFMNDKERRIVLYDVKTAKLETMATGAITAPYRIPGERAVTFVVLDGEARVLKRLDLDAKRVTTLATIPFKTGGQHVWTSRNAMLIASGPAIYEWSPARADDWKIVYRAEHPDLQGITRIAVSPKGDRIALVSTPRDETIIRESRAASNQAIAAHQADVESRFFREDASLTASNGQHYDGREAIEKSLTERFATLKDVVYIRTPELVEISRADNAASERGTWTGRWMTEQGPVEVRGSYMAVWRREISDSGTPSWQLQSSLFVRLE